jgi:hypothetical protein
MSRDKDLVVAKYIPELTTDGQLARIVIEFHGKTLTVTLSTTPIRVHLRR